MVRLEGEQFEHGRKDRPAVAASLCRQKALLVVPHTKR